MESNLVLLPFPFYNLPHNLSTSWALFSARFNFLRFTSETERIQVLEALKDLVMNRCSSFQFELLTFGPFPYIQIALGHP